MELLRVGDLVGLHLAVAIGVVLEIRDIVGIRVGIDFRMLARHVIELVGLCTCSGRVMLVGVGVMFRGIRRVLVRVVLRGIRRVLVGVMLRGIRRGIRVMIRPVSFGRVVMVGRVIGGVVMLGIGI